jgi:hypothetical protein
MIEITVKVDGINLDVSHDGELIHDVTFYGATESLFPILNQHARDEIESATGKRFYRPRPEEVLPDPMDGVKCMKATLDMLDDALNGRR